MPSYWWECESCNKKAEFPQACNSKGVAHYIRDVLLPSSWDQDSLLIQCKRCGKKSLRITYEFPRPDKETLRVIHIVGLGNVEEPYVPMMWETYPLSNPTDKCFDFKYISGRSLFGLTKPAVFSLAELKKLFETYREKTGITDFP